MQWVTVHGMHIHHLVWGILILLLVFHRLMEPEVQWTHVVGSGGGEIAGLHALDSVSRLCQWNCD